MDYELVCENVAESNRNMDCLALESPHFEKIMEMEFKRAGGGRALSGIIEVSGIGLINKLAEFYYRVSTLSLFVIYIVISTSPR